MIAKDLEKLKAERAAWEAERDRRTIEEIESRQKQFEDRLMSNYDRLRDEVMRLNKADLMNIKDERQRQREIDNLAISGFGLIVDTAGQKFNQPQGFSY